MKVSIPSILKLFSRARALHRGERDFAGAATLIADETGVALPKVRAVLTGGFSSADTQSRIAAWNGLKRATKHDEPCLVVDHGAVFDPEPFAPGGGRGARPISVDEAIRRVQTRLALKGAV